MKRSITFLFPFFLILLCSFKIETFQWAYDANYKININNNCESYVCNSSSPLLVPNFKFYFGGANADYFTKVITHGGDYYAIGNSAGRASLTRISNAGNVVWTRELSITSAWNDLIITTNNEILLVGINGNYDNNAKSLIGTCTLGGIMNVKSYNYSNRESLTKIYLNPNPENSNFPYYIIGVSNSGGSSLDDILIINANSTGAINWSKNIYNPSQDFEFYRDISIQSNTGDMVLIGNNLGKAAMVQINKSGTVINAIEYNENMRFNTIVSNSTPIAGYNHLLGGSNNVTTVAQLMKVNGLSTILYNYKVDSLDAITKIIPKPSGGYYALGRGTIRGANRSVVLSLSEVGNSLTLDWSKTLADNSSLYTFGYLGLMNSSQIAFTEGRQNAINGFGSTDGFISIDNLDFENCLTLKLNLKLSPLNSTNTTFSPNTLDIVTPTPSILNANSPIYNQKNVCAFVCNVGFEIQPGNCGIIQFFPSTNQTGTLSYCWDFGDNPPCGSVIQNPIHQFQNNGSYTVCVTIKDGVNSCEDCKIINVSNVDNQAPTVNCPQDISISCKQSILPFVTGNPFVTDNLDPAPSVSYTDQIMNSSPCDTSIKRTWLVLDRCNNKKSCIQFIAKKDNIKPNITCPADITIDCQFVPSTLLTGNATASDDCQSQIVISYTDQIVNNLPCGSIISRTFSAADNCGNKSTCIQKITKRDIEKPRIQCPNNFTINCNEQNPSPTKYGYPTATDNCQINSNIQFSYSDKLIGTLPCPNKLERSWFALDSCGNSASCLQVFNFEAPKTIHFSEILATMDSSGISGELHEIISCGSYARIFCKPNNSWEKGKSKYILNFEGDLLVSVGGTSKIQWKLYSDPTTLINDGKLTISENEDHFKFEALKISDLIPKNIYSLYITGFHEKDSMSCSLTFSIEDLLPISIDFSNIKLSTSINGLPGNNEISATCGSFNSLRIGSRDTFPENIIVRGDLIVNEDSLSSIWWKLLDSNNILVNQGKVIIPENSDAFNLVSSLPLKKGQNSGRFNLQLIGGYKNDSAICDLKFFINDSFLPPIKINFSNIKLSTSSNGKPNNNEISASCGSFNSLRIGSRDTFPENIIVRGDLIVNEDSISSIWWKLLDSNNILVNQGNVIIPENSDAFYAVAPRPLKQGDTGRIFILELLGRYKKDSTICELKFIIKDSFIPPTKIDFSNIKLSTSSNGKPNNNEISASCGSFNSLRVNTRDTFPENIIVRGDLIVNEDSLSSIWWKLLDSNNLVVNQGKFVIPENSDAFNLASSLPLKKGQNLGLFNLELIGRYKNDSAICNLKIFINDSFLPPIKINFSNLKLSTSSNGKPNNNEISASCGSFNSLRIDVRDTFPENIIVRGDLIVNEDSISSIWWKLLDSNNIVVNQGKVIIPENSDTFYLVAPRTLKQGTSPSQYRLELIGRYKNDSALCNIQFSLVQSEICCTDTATLRLKLESAIRITYDHEFCQANMVITDLSNSCNINVVSISWGDGTREKGSFSNGDVLTHSYFPNDKTYIIKLNVLEYDTNDNICNSIQIKKNILTDCDDCSELVDIQLYNKKFEKPVVCDSAGFKHLIPTGENYFNISGKIICSKTNTKFIDYQITDLDSANFIIQGTAKTDTDNIWDIENLLFSDFNLSHHYLVEIDRKCKSQNCKCNFEIEFEKSQSNCLVKMETSFASVQEDPTKKIANVELTNFNQKDGIDFIGIESWSPILIGLDTAIGSSLSIDGKLKEKIWHPKKEPQSKADLFYPPAMNKINFNISLNENYVGTTYFNINKTNESTCVIPLEWKGKLVDPLPYSIINIPYEINPGYTLATTQFQILNQINSNQIPKYVSIGFEDTLDAPEFFAISGSIHPLDDQPANLIHVTDSKMGRKNGWWEIKDDTGFINKNINAVFKIKKGSKKNLVYSYSIFDAKGEIIGEGHRNKLKLFENLTIREIIEESESKTNKDIELLDYYPNPTKDKLVIKYKLDKPDDLNISVHNIHGLEIRTYKLDSQNPGVHAFDLNTKNIKAGVYIIRLIGVNNQISFPIEIIN